jgi:multisubunit Na+/H+ antiporter MnhC subunit
MPQLDLSFTFTPALVLTAIVFDAGLVMLGIAIMRHMREQRRPQQHAAPAENPSASRVPTR